MSSICQNSSRKDINQLVDSVLEHHAELEKRLDENPTLKRRILTNRKRLAANIEDFHRKSGTLTESIKERTEHLKSRKDSIFLMTAHQTNFIPYSGVVRKTTLMHTIRKELEKKTDTSIIEYFGLADQDMTGSWPWLNMTQLPSIYHKNGILELRYSTPEIYSKKIHASVPKPDATDMARWKSQTFDWIRLCASSIEKSDKPVNPTTMERLLANFDDFFSILEDSQKSADNFAEMNAITLSKITAIMGHDTLFSKYTETQRNFDHEFAYLLGNTKAYHKYLGDARKETHSRLIAPFWYHCECLGKVELEVKDEKRIIELKGTCPSCSKRHAFILRKDRLKKDISDISRNISARARPMALIFFEGLAVDMYVGGALANKCYIKEADYIAQKISTNRPVMAVWRPRDIYSGLGQLSCSLEKQAICKNNSTESAIMNLEQELDATKDRISQIESLISRTTSTLDRKKLIKEIEEIRRQHDTRTISKRIATLRKIPNSESVYPSILDYAINIGLKDTARAWSHHLKACNNMDESTRIDTLISKATGDEKPDEARRPQ